MHGNTETKVSEILMILDTLGEDELLEAYREILADDLRPRGLGVVEWIPCADRLPPSYESVLIARDDWSHYGYFTGQIWRIGDNSPIVSVTHWAALPAPPYVPASNTPPADTKSMSHPMQPIVFDNSGVARFKQNAIVRYLLDAGPFDLNRLAVMPFSQEDREQFAQLIGYSVGGYGELHAVSRESVEKADAIVEQMMRTNTPPVQPESNEVP